VPLAKPSGVAVQTCLAACTAGICRPGQNRCADLLAAFMGVRLLASMCAALDRSGAWAA